MESDYVASNWKIQNPSGNNNATGPMDLGCETSLYRL